MAKSKSKKSEILEVQNVEEVLESTDSTETIITETDNTTVLEANDNKPQDDLLTENVNKSHALKEHKHNPFKMRPNGVHWAAGGGF